MKKFYVFLFVLCGVYVNTSSAHNFDDPVESDSLGSPMNTIDDTGAISSPRSKKRKRVDVFCEERKKIEAPIIISFRNDGKGKGAFWDHDRYQQITGRSTYILNDVDLFHEFLRHLVEIEGVDDNPESAENVRKHYLQFKRKESHTDLEVLWDVNVLRNSDKYEYSLLKNAIANNVYQSLNTMPEFCKGNYRGLFVGTGRAKDTETNRYRTEQETYALRMFDRNGSPIFLTCGASVPFTAYFGGTVDLVDHHVNLILDDQGDPMIRHRLDASGIKNNHQVHGMLVKKGTLMAQAMFGSVVWAKYKKLPTDSMTSEERWESYQKAQEDEVIQVNSIHDRAISTPPRSGFIVSAETVIDAVHQIPSIEAVESLYGAPQIFFQGHAEAYDENSINPKISAEEASPYQNLIKYMAKSGDIPVARKDVNKELLLIFATVQKETPVCLARKRKNENLKEQQEMPPTRPILKRHISEETRIITNLGTGSDSMADYSNLDILGQ